MQAQTSVVFPVQPQVVGQTRVVPVQTITANQERDAASTSNGRVILEIMFRVLCVVSCLLVVLLRLGPDRYFVCV